MRAACLLIGAPSIGRAVTVMEMAVEDLRALIKTQSLGGMDEAGAAALTLSLLTDLSGKEARLLGAEDLARIFEAAQKLNGDVFAPAPAPENGAGNPEGELKTLEISVSKVIAAGHPNAWGYPFSVFQSAVEALTEGQD